jgi:hypothetical protein
VLSLGSVSNKACYRRAPAFPQTSFSFLIERQFDFNGFLQDRVGLCEWRRSRWPGRHERVVALPLMQPFVSGGEVAGLRTSLAVLKASAKAITTLIMYDRCIRPAVIGIDADVAPLLAARRTGSARQERRSHRHAPLTRAPRAYLREHRLRLLKRGPRARNRFVFCLELYPGSRLLLPISVCRLHIPLLRRRKPCSTSFFICRVLAFWKDQPGRKGLDRQRRRSISRRRSRNGRGAGLRRRPTLRRS